MEKNRRKLGSAYEEAACAYLKERGYRLLHKNYRCRIGELDLVMQDGETIVFVEVKARMGDTSGTALEAVDARKQAVLQKLAVAYLTKEIGSLEVPCRFDVVGVDQGKISHVKNAFWMA